MGALASIASGLGTIASVVGSASSIANNIAALGQDPQKEAKADLRRQQELALKQLREQQQAAAATAQAETDLQKTQIAATASAEEMQRRAALKRAVARQRAAFGSQGVGSTDGSSEAVLLGLFDESDRERQDREKLDSIRAAALDQDLSARNSLNVLQLAQLQERQKLERLRSRE